MADLKVPDVRLDYYQEEDPDENDYDGLDRFGRIKDQYWDGYGSTADVDRFHYTHDNAGNRLTRDIDANIYATNDKDELYTYDDQYRLDEYKEGTLADGAITSPLKRRRSGLALTRRPSVEACPDAFSVEQHAVSSGQALTYVTCSRKDMG